MARGKKTEKVLTPEEKLEQALVPVEEQPYPVPENWCWVRVAAVSEFERGITFPSSAKEHEATEHNIPCLRTANIQDEIEIDDLLFVNKEFVKGNKAKLVHADDIIMSSANSRELVGKTAYVYSVPFPMTFGGFVLIIRAKSILSKYLFYFLRLEFLSGSFMGESTQTTNIANINTTKLGNYVLPLPPYAEQQRIVDRIESLFAKLDEVKEKVQAVIDGFETRKAVLLHKAFTGKLTAQWRKDNFIEASLLLNQIDEEISKTKKKTIKKVVNVIDETYMKLPSNWLIVDLDRISKKITDGEHKTPSRVNFYCGYYLLSARNIYNDSLLLDDVDYVDESEYGKIGQRCNPHKGDVLISCSGSVGRTCVIDDNNNYCMVRSAAMISISKCNARYIMYAIQSDIVQHQIKRLSKQTAQANLFIGAIAAINIPLPPVEEQAEIVRIIDNIITKEMHTKNIAEDILNQIDTMKKSILARAFRGELRTNDPSEESAVELLKKYC